MYDKSCFYVSSLYILYMIVHTAQYSIINPTSIYNLTDLQPVLLNSTDDFRMAPFHFGIKLSVSYLLSPFSQLLAVDSVLLCVTV